MRNHNDFLINKVYQLYHHLLVSIIKIQRERNLHDSLILTQCNSYIIIDQLSNFEKRKLTN